MGNAFPLVFVVFIAVAIGFAVMSYRAQQKRTKELQALCLARGWTYTASAPELVDRWQGTPFGEGDDRKARHVIGGTWQGAQFVAFDYSYVTTTTDADGRTTARRTTTVSWRVVLPAYLPNLQVTGQSMFRRMAQAVGLGQDIELESEDFNRAFTVTSRDPKFATDVLTPRTMEMLLAAPHLAWRIEGDGHPVVGFRQLHDC